MFSKPDHNNSPPAIYAGRPSPFHGGFHVSNPPDNLAEGIWIGYATGSYYVHVNSEGRMDNFYCEYFDGTPPHWADPEIGFHSRFKKGDLVKYKKEYNNYGDCLATQMARKVVEYLEDPHPGYECWDGHPSPHWYILDPEGHHWCDPEHGLELVTEHDKEG